MAARHCNLVAQISAAAEQSLLLPQYAERLTGLLYFSSGSGTLAGTSGPPLPMKAGTAAVYPAWHPHRLTAHEDASIFLCTFLRDPIDQPAHLAKASPLYLNALMQIMERTCGMVLTENLLEQLTEPASPENGNNIPPFVQAVRRIIDNCYSEDLTLEDLSARVGRSKYHLSRAFREYYGVTIGAYLTSVRLVQAEKLLADTGIPVREIGRQVGFTNSTYFTSLFKQRFGCPPREYRTLQKNAGL